MTNSQKRIFDGFALLIGSLMMLAAASCNSIFDGPYDDGPEYVDLELNVTVPSASVSRDGGELPDYYSATTDYEKIHTLRVILCDPDGVVEANELVPLLKIYSRVEYTLKTKVKNNETKTVYLLANEPERASASAEAIDYAELAKPGQAISADLLNLVLQNTHTDLANAYLPMTGVYRVPVNAAMGQDKVSSPEMRLLRCHTKFTFVFENSLHSPSMQIKNLTVENISDRSFLFAKDDKGLSGWTYGTDGNWTEFATGAAPTVSGGDQAPNDKSYTDYYKRNYLMPTGSDYAAFQELASGRPITDEATTLVYYLNESRYNQDGDGIQHYILSLDMTDNGSTKHYSKELPNLKQLPRNTHVVVRVNIVGSEMVLKVSVLPYLGVTLKPTMGTSLAAITLNTDYLRLFNSFKSTGIIIARDENGHNITGSPRVEWRSLYVNTGQEFYFGEEYSHEDHPNLYSSATMVYREAGATAWTPINNSFYDTAAAAREAWRDKYAQDYETAVLFTSLVESKVDKNDVGSNRLVATYTTPEGLVYTAETYIGVNVRQIYFNKTYLGLIPGHADDIDPVIVAEEGTSLVDDLYYIVTNKEESSINIETPDLTGVTEDNFHEKIMDLVKDNYSADLVTNLVTVEPSADGHKLVVTPIDNTTEGKAYLHAYYLCVHEDDTKEILHAVCEVEVAQPSIYMRRSEAHLVVGQTTSVLTQVRPLFYDHTPKVKFKSSDPEYVDVSEHGIVTARKGTSPLPDGYAIVTAYNDEDYDFVVSNQIKIYVNDNRLVLDRTEVNMCSKSGDEDVVTLQAYYYGPGSTSGKKVNSAATWSYSKSTVGTSAISSVTGGKITLVNDGGNSLDNTATNYHNTYVVKAEYEGLTAECVVVIYNDRKIIIENNNRELTVTGQAQLKARLFPIVDESAQPTITWESSKTSVASVNSKGLVTARKAGSATIKATATYNKNDYSSTTTVTVIDVVAVEGPTTLAKGEESDYTLYTMDDIATGITWSSSDTNVLSIGENTGHAKAREKGTAVITATYTMNGSTQTSTLTVTVK